MPPSCPLLRSRPAAVSLILALLLAAWPPGLAAGAGPDPAGALLAEGRAQLTAGAAHEAYATLHRAFVIRPDDPEINFSLGRAAVGIGDYEAAAMAFERILIHDPESVGARLELAKAYYRLGARATAMGYFEEVLAADIPEATRQEIEQFLDAVREEPQPRPGNVR